MPTDGVCGVGASRTTVQEVARWSARSSAVLKKLSHESVMPVAALAAATTSEALTNERGCALSKPAATTYADTLAATVARSLLRAARAIPSGADEDSPEFVEDRAVNGH
jgi:hypothetical protein